MDLLDGRKAAQNILTKLKKNVEALPVRAPHLVCIIVGDDPSSHTYVGMKRKRCTDIGIESTVIELSSTISEEELLSEIEKQNRAPHVDGILVQQPLPDHISIQKVIQAIAPEKDVDGFHPINAGKLLSEDPTGFVPCTPLGIYELLKCSNIPLSGAHIVIMGRSSIVGKPLTALLLQKGIDATVSVVHSKTKDPAAITRLADILIVAIGSPHAITSDMISPGTVVVDVGITRTDSGLFGDVSPEGLDQVAEKLTPVPGGVGPMTVAMLLQNTIKAYIQRM